MGNKKNYCLGNYDILINKFLENGYNFVKFSEFNQDCGQVALRHDIDYDVELALKCAELEKKLGIFSTYFFLLRGPFYNPFAGKEFAWINEIRNMGHSISLHFDPILYSNFYDGFKFEIDIFKKLFEVDIDIVSIHRPNAFFQNLDAPILNIKHTYQKMYCQEKKYISDSTGEWRFGSPINSEEFKLNKSIHLLTHPVWWFLEGEKNMDVLKSLFKNKIENSKNDFLQNSKIFKSIINEI